jgi:cell division GTPase FtsZ
MRHRGRPHIGVGEATGEGRAAAALQQALTNPLLESTDISRATGVLASFSGGQDMSLFEVEEALALLRDKLDTDTQACAIPPTPRPSPLALITSPPPHHPSLLAPHSSPPLP